MASDLGEEMDTETETSGDIRNLLPKEGSVNAYGFHLGEMKANRTKMMARHVVKLGLLLRVEEHRTRHQNGISFMT